MLEIGHQERAEQGHFILEFHFLVMIDVSRLFELNIV
jgi:hypothetical protein